MRPTLARLQATLLAAGGALVLEILIPVCVQVRPTLARLQAALLAAGGALVLECLHPKT